jgi:hypothetical protein
MAIQQEETDAIRGHVQIHEQQKYGQLLQGSKRIIEDVTRCCTRHLKQILEADGVMVHGLGSRNGHRKGNFPNGKHGVAPISKRIIEDVTRCWTKHLKQIVEAEGSVKDVGGIFYFSIEVEDTIDEVVTKKNIEGGLRYFPFRDDDETIPLGGMGFSYKGWVMVPGLGSSCSTDG